MNREDIIWSPEDLERFFANFVAAAERDECARTVKRARWLRVYAPYCRVSGDGCTRKG
jgi:hypothetical protein